MLKLKVTAQILNVLIRRSPTHFEASGLRVVNFSVYWQLAKG